MKKKTMAQIGRNIFKSDGINKESIEKTIMKMEKAGYKRLKIFNAIKNIAKLDFKIKIDYQKMGISKISDNSNNLNVEESRVLRSEKKLSKKKYLEKRSKELDKFLDESRGKQIERPQGKMKVIEEFDKWIEENKLKKAS